MYGRLQHDSTLLRSQSRASFPGPSVVHPVISVGIHEFICLFYMSVTYVCIFKHLNMHQLMSFLRFFRLGKSKALRRGKYLL